MSDTAKLTAALAGRYRIERELGAGGMATVYLAQDLRHDRRVAVKVLRPELAAVIGAERFLSEIKTTAALQHPHILPLHDSGDADGLLFYVMPYVEGETVRDRISREKQLPVADAVRIASEVASALDYAHRHGVIHRDIKPENILLQDGEAVVADFGIALAVDAAGGTRLTATGMSIGTPQYMSPEQALAEPSLDGRSDIYSLGTVLFEMLAGEPPFTGVTAQAIIARRLAQPAPSVRVLRETVAESLDAALDRALARIPADRFGTAAVFAAAISGRVETPRPAAALHPRGRRGSRLAWAGALLLAAAVALLRWTSRPAPVLDPDLIAVAPFDAIGPGLDVWREGVVDLLSRTLDGAGSLRTASPSVVLRGWEGRSDRASAMALGRRVGAGLVATGSVSQRDTGAITLRASLFDVARNELIDEVEVAGSLARSGELMDSLGLEILRSLARTRPVAAVSQTAIGSAPLAALKAFLVGEQFYRRALYDSALAAYSEAIAEDSGFTLAYGRMGTVLGWSPPTVGAYEPADSFIARAIVRNRGLGPRDSLFLRADSMGWAGDQGHPELYRALLALRQEATRRYPGDPEAWYRRGENYYHLDKAEGGDIHAALAAFERAVALDPGFFPAYEHVLDASLATGREDLARHYAATIAQIPATAGSASLARLVARLLILPDRERAEAADRIADSTSATVLFRAGVEVFPWVPDSAETSVRLLRRLASRSVEEGETERWVVDSLMRLRYVAAALTARGHVREAATTDRALIENPDRSVFSGLGDPYLYLAMFGVIPVAEAARAFDSALEPGRPAGFFERRWAGLPWLAARRDTAAVARFERRVSKAMAEASSPRARLRGDYLRAAAEANLALLRGDTALALTRFEALPDSACDFSMQRQCLYQQLTEASLLAARGQDQGAAALLDEWMDRLESVSPVGVLARLERARIAERLGDPATALRHYQFVADAWRHADPELMPYVTQARDGLARLAGEPR